MVIFTWIKGVKDEQKTRFTGSIESDPIDSKLRSNHITGLIQIKKNRQS